MKKFLLSCVALAALTMPASASITFESNLSGTGDNVIFNSLSGNVALGSLNGQHQGIIEFRALDVPRYVARTRELARALGVALPVRDSA